MLYQQFMIKKNGKLFNKFCRVSKKCLLVETTALQWLEEHLKIHLYHSPQIGNVGINRPT